MLPEASNATSFCGALEVALAHYQLQTLNP